MTKEEALKKTPEELMSLGYRRTSNAYGIISRIDRSDWKEYMADQHSPWSREEGMHWVELLHRNNAAEDFYRRCLSKDNIEFGRRDASKVRYIETSNWAMTGFKEDMEEC